MKKFVKAKSGGFTLIELLVVVLIIGILSAIALPQYTQAVEKSRAAEAMSNIGSFQRAVNIWKLANPGRDARFSAGGGAFGELDIAIPDDWVQGTAAMMTGYDPSSNSCSKTFCYKIDTNHVKVHRANSSTYKYAIELWFPSNSYSCDARTEADLKICKALSNIKYVNESL